MLRRVWRSTLVRQTTLKRTEHGGRRAFSVIAATRQHDPLNILFCGADQFSISSLRALRELQMRRPEKIASIDVVCRPDKATGRGLKNVRQVPIKPIATELDLPLHQIDTFRNWSPLPSINLVVAVSFGLLVPARILTGAKYGGLNVHPSLLPDLRGPAPIVHTLLMRRSHTGVTIQTMHPTKFDHGEISAQTPAPGLAVPKGSTPQRLLEVLGPLGAQMLAQTIERGLFVPPVQSIDNSMKLENVEHAPKTTPEDRHIDWNTWSSDEIILRDRVLGRLWDTHTYARCGQASGDATSRRVAFAGPWRFWEEAELGLNKPEYSKGMRHSAGDPILVSNPDVHPEPVFGFWTSDGKIVSPSSATIDGGKKGTGLLALVARMGRAKID